MGLIGNNVDLLQYWKQKELKLEEYMNLLQPNTEYYKRYEAKLEQLRECMKDLETLQMPGKHEGVFINSYR